VIYRNIVIFTTFLSVPLSYFALAPVNGLVGGLELGAVGMALKTYAISAISSNIQLYIISRLYGIKYEFLFQLASLGLLIAASYVVRFVTDIFMESFFSANNLIVIMSCGFIIYAPIAFLIIYTFPSLIGLDRERLIQGVRQYRVILKGSK